KTIPVKMRYLLGWFFALFSMISWAAAEDTPAASPSPSPSPVSSPEAPSGAPKPATWFSVNVDGPYIAMTFDDGPSPETTPRLLEILKQRNIKATFFMIGQNAQSNPAIVQRILAEGHEIGNHSWTHPQLSKLSNDRVSEEITKTQAAIKNACGYTPVLLRPPYGAITARQKEWIEKQFGLSVIIWSVDPFRLETARRLRDRAADSDWRAPRGDHSLPRYPQADSRCDAGYTRCPCGKRVQVCDRQSTDCDEQAQEQPQPAIASVG